MARSAAAGIDVASDSPAAAWPLSRLGKLGAWAFAITTPAAGLAFVAGAGLLEMNVLPALAFTSIAMATMAAWLHAPNVGTRGHAIACGVFAAFALGATRLAIGCMILLVYDGIWSGLGRFTWIVMPLVAWLPLLGLITYWVAAVRAWRLSRGKGVTTAIAAVLLLALPALAARGLRSLARADEALVLCDRCSLDGAPLERWRLLAPRHRWPVLREAHAAATDDARRRRLADAYRRLTGRGPYD